jgi:D-alanine-D-alanine ligase
MMEDMEKLRVGVIFGGRSGEHEVALMSARSVLGALDPDKYQVSQIGITHDGAWLTGEDVLSAMESGRHASLSSVTMLPDPTRRGLYKLIPSSSDDLLEFLTAFDVVFPVLHGTFGEDGTLQGLFELADLSYVGAGVLGSSLAMDKGVFKDVMRANDIPVLESIIVQRGDIERQADVFIEKAEQLAPYPLFTKPANLGSSVGVSKCNNRSDLLEGMMDAAQYDRRVLVERGVNGREIEVSVLGNDNPQASIPGEVIPAAEFYSYQAKYHDDRSELLIPAPLPREVADLVQYLAVKAYRAIDCAGMARVDFLLDRDSGKLFLNELNTIPGFTRISMYPKLWEASGLSYPALVDRLIELALERKGERDRTERRFHREN